MSLRKFITLGRQFGKTEALKRQTGDTTMAKTTTKKPAAKAAAKPKASPKAKSGVIHCKDKAGKPVSVVRDQIQAVRPCQAKGGGWEDMFDVFLKDTGHIITVDRNPLA